MVKFHPPLKDISAFCDFSSNPARSDPNSESHNINSAEHFQKKRTVRRLASGPDAQRGSVRFFWKCSAEFILRGSLFGSD